MHLIIDHTFWIFKRLLSPRTVPITKEEFYNLGIWELDVCIKLPFVMTFKTKKSSSQKQNRKVAEVWGVEEIGRSW